MGQCRGSGYGHLIEKYDPTPAPEIPLRPMYCEDCEMEVEAALFSFLRGGNGNRTVYKAGWICPECGELVSHDAVIPVMCNDEILFGCSVRYLPSYQRNMPMGFGRDATCHPSYQRNMPKGRN